MDVNLIVIGKSGQHRSYTLPSSVTIVGRRKDCDLCIPLSEVSKRHCQINQEKEGLRLRDLGSKNGTLLNGNRIEHAKIKAGDELAVGPLKFIIQVNGDPDIKTTKPASSTTASSLGDDELPDQTDDDLERGVQQDSDLLLDDFEALDEGGMVDDDLEI